MGSDITCSPSKGRTLDLNVKVLLMEGWNLENKDYIKFGTGFISLSEHERACIDIAS